MADFAVSAIHGGPNNEGRVFVYSGLDGTLIFAVTGEFSGDLFGASISGAGDINSDGIPDLIVGAPENDTTGTDAGRVYAFSGSNGTLLFTLTGESEDDQFGLSVAGGSDFNTDGLNDILVGAPGFHEAALPCLGCNEHGRVYLFHTTGSGNDRNANDAELIMGPTNFSDFFYGHEVQIGNDVNNDGIDEIIVIAAYEDEQSSIQGRMYVVSGSQLDKHSGLQPAKRMILLQLGDHVRYLKFMYGIARMKFIAQQHALVLREHGTNIMQNSV